MSSSPRKAAPAPGPPATVLLGQNLYRIRVLRLPPMSQGALAAASDVSQETIRLIERNRLDNPERQLDPHVGIIDKLAAALGVPAAALLEDDQATPSKPTGRRDRSHLKIVRGTGGGLPAAP